MKQLSIFIKKIGFTSGVIVSVKHLSKLLMLENINFEIVEYENDAELLAKAEKCNSACLMLQVPSFSDYAMNEILSMNKNVVLSIHSTLCNLQAEEGALLRILNWCKLENNNFQITCPSACEVDGFNAFSNINFIYLPNTFSYKVSDWEIRNLIEEKNNKMISIKISLFCAFRPLKNMMIQVAAIAKLAHKYSIELHIFRKDGNPIYESIKNIASQSRFRLVIHNQMSNKECFELTKQMHLGLQVSVSETFSYAAFEHMILGIPVVGSDSIPFSTKVAKYNDVNDIERCLVEIIQSGLIYKNYALRSRKIANDIKIRNSDDALLAIHKIIKGSKNL